MKNYKKTIIKPDRIEALKALRKEQLSHCLSDCENGNCHYCNAYYRDVNNYYKKDLPWNNI